jgi:hypothetical protein
MVAKRAEDRQQSMTAVIGDLERLQMEGAAAVEMQWLAAVCSQERVSAAPQLAKVGQSRRGEIVPDSVFGPRSWFTHVEKRTWLSGSLIGGSILLAGVALTLWVRSGGRVIPAQGPRQAPKSEGTRSPGSARLPGIPPQLKPEAAGNRSPSGKLPDLEFEKWLAHLADLPAEEQVDAVARKLPELNPGFDAKLEPQIENGRVTILEFQADDLHDLSPVQAFRGLKGLFCYRTAGRKGDFSDLSPLQNLPLENLYCGLSAVADLSPLKEMRLSFLNIGVTNVRDLSPLSGMPLRSLDLGATQVSNLAPLAGMPLEYLNCSATNVTDLSPLRGMPLKELRCDFVRERDAEILHSILTLEKINGKPVAEFWADVDDDQVETSR